MYRNLRYTSPMAARRSKGLNVRLTDEEVAMAKEVAERMGLSQSDAIRQLVRQAHADTKPKAKRKTK